MNMIMNWHERLETILGESDGAARKRESTYFDRVSGGHPIVLFGAGSLGRRLARGLRACGCELLAFSDNNPSIWDQELEGTKVLSPQVAADRFGRTAVFVIAIWHPSRTGGLRQVAEQLQQLGCDRVAPFVWLLWKYPGTFLPYYLWDLPSKLLRRSEEILRASKLFDDEVSRREFVSQVAFRATGNFSCISEASLQVQYFPDDLFRLLPEEVFVDCGAYDGDSLRDFIRVTGGRFKRIIAFEPDPSNCSSLNGFLNGEPEVAARITCYPCALGRVLQRVRFRSTGLANAAVSQEGEIEVQCVTLDQALKGECPTFIKMDIEGAELDALWGGADIIRRDKPLLAICTYHQQDHLWQIPLTLRQLLPESRLFLRAHCLDGFDLVCYAVPKERPSA